jgi:hypothetical protein
MQREPYANHRQGDATCRPSQTNTRRVSDTRNAVGAGRSFVFSRVESYLWSSCREFRRSLYVRPHDDKCTVWTRAIGNSHVRQHARLPARAHPIRQFNYFSRCQDHALIPLTNERRGSAAPGARGSRGALTSSIKRGSLARARRGEGESKRETAAGLRGGRASARSSSAVAAQGGPA